MLRPLKFARSKLFVDGVQIAKITSLGENINPATTETTAAEDTIKGSDVLNEQQTITKTATELSFEMIAMFDDSNNDLDDGQAELLRKARAGADVVIERWLQNGKGYLYTGVITSMSSSSSVSDGIYKYSGDLHCNEEPSSISH